MSNRLAGLLKELKKIRGTQTHRLECQTVTPFLLVGQDGTPFTVVGLSKGCFFSSPYFSVVSINEEIFCAVLEVLYPCCCGKNLFRSEARVLVDLTFLCGIETMATPIYECLEQSHITTERICLPFMLTKQDSSKVVYSIEWKEPQHTETVSIHYNGPDPEVELLIYTNEEIITLRIPKDTFQSRTVFNLQSIEIVSPTERVNGTIDIQLNYCEKKNIYF